MTAQLLGDVRSKRKLRSLFARCTSLARAKRNRASSEKLEGIRDRKMWGVRLEVFSAQ